MIDLSTGRITGTAELGIGAPTQMTVSADKTRAYIVDYDNVTVLCTLTLKIVEQGDRRRSAVLCRSRFRRGPAVRGRLCGRGDGVVRRSRPMPLLYSQFMETNPIYVPAAAELEPVTA